MAFVSYPLLCVLGPEGVCYTFRPMSIMSGESGNTVLPTLQAQGVGGAATPEE